MEIAYGNGFAMRSLSVYLYDISYPDTPHSFIEICGRGFWALGEIYGKQNHTICIQWSFSENLPANIPLAILGKFVVS